MADRYRVPNKALAGKQQADIVKVLLQHKNSALHKSKAYKAKQFIQMTALPPAQRLEEIKMRAGYITNKHNADDNFRSLGAYIQPGLLQVQGRVLPAPAVTDVRF